MFKPTEEHRKTAKRMAKFGIPQRAIAEELGISPDTMRKHLREELNAGMTEANMAVAESLFQKATGEGAGAVTAAIFWSKTRMGWRETQVVEHASVIAAEEEPNQSGFRFRDLDNFQLQTFVDWMQTFLPERLAVESWPTEQRDQFLNFMEMIGSSDAEPNMEAWSKDQLKGAIAFSEALDPQTHIALRKGLENHG